MTGKVRAGALGHGNVHPVPPDPMRRREPRPSGPGRRRRPPFPPDSHSAVMPAVPALHQPHAPVRNTLADAPARAVFHVEISPRPHRYPARPPTSTLPAKHFRHHQVAGLEAKVPLPPRPVPDGKTATVHVAHLPGPPPDGRPDLHVLLPDRNALRRARPHAAGIKVVLLGQAAL